MMRSLDKGYGLIIGEGDDDSDKGHLSLINLHLLLLSSSSSRVVPSASCFDLWIQGNKVFLVDVPRIQEIETLLCRLSR